MRAPLAVVVALGLPGCLGHEPNPAEEAAPVTIGACQSQRCGANVEALIGTWKLDRGCATREDQFGCPDTRIFPRVAAAGTIGFTADTVSFDIKVFNENTVELPLSCFGSPTCASLDGLFGEGSTCSDLGEGRCTCDYYVVQSLEFDINYFIEGQVMRTGFGEDYDICLLGDTLNLSRFTPADQDLEQYTLVRVQ